MEYQISLFGEGFWERPFMAAIQIIHLDIPRPLDANLL
jgi:hypothetical protein